MGTINMPLKIVGYSKTAPFNGGTGYVLVEVKQDHLVEMSTIVRTRTLRWKLPMNDFLRDALK